MLVSPFAFPAPQLLDDPALEAASRAAEAAQKKLYSDVQATQLRFKVAAHEARLKLGSAKGALLQAQNNEALARAGVVAAASPESAIRDRKACHPVPKCLQDLVASGGCKGDVFPISTCLKARQGKTNLCASSEVAQKNCCQTCALSEADACRRVSHVALSCLCHHTALSQRLMCVAGTDGTRRYG